MEETTRHFREFCPRCGVPRPLQAVKETITEIDPAGRQVKVSVLSLHCTICHTFVRSEHNVVPPEHEEGKP